jgi:nitroimidazol reductase NimA-like FMN-containing flavoprotein (pyridoxamine 5'-phosphate oxidase superfamily)
MPKKDYSLETTPPHEQRRPQLAQDDAWIRDFLQQAPIAHIATRWDDQPFITPTTFWYDADAHTIFFHSNVLGRLRANSDRHPQACFEASRFGGLLPSNAALEFSVRYESVVAYGTLRVLDDPGEQRRALYGLIGRYFPDLEPGTHFRPITDTELVRTSVYALEITSWSGKRNWAEQADQIDAWPALEGDPARVRPWPMPAGPEDFL